MPTWHRETEAPAKSFLQFDLEHGAKSDISGGALREGEDGDQALGSVQGTAKQTKRKDYSKLESLESVQDEPNAGTAQAGKENRYAFSVMKPPEKPSNEDILDYQAQAKTIESYQKRLKQMIQKRLSIKKHSREPICMQAD